MKPCMAESFGVRISIIYAERSVRVSGEQFTLAEHRHISSVSAQRAAQQYRCFLAVCFDKTRHQPHGEQRVRSAINKGWREGGAAFTQDNGAALHQISGKD